MSVFKEDTWILGSVSTVFPTFATSQIMEPLKNTTVHLRDNENEEGK